MIRNSMHKRCYVNEIGLTHKCFGLSQEVNIMNGMHNQLDHQVNELITW